MKSTLALTLVAAAAISAGLPPAASAGPYIAVYAGPAYYRPYYPRYYIPIYPGNLYGGYYPGSGVIISGAPSLANIGPGYVTPPGTILQAAPTAVPQLATLPGNAALQGGAAAPVAALNQGEMDQALQLLANPREHDRIEGALALGRARAVRAVEPLQTLLAADPSPRVRDAAARALGLIGSPSSLRALQTAAQSDDDRDVRRSAQFAAETIRGNAFQR